MGKMIQEMEKPMFRIMHLFMGIAALVAFIIVWCLSSQIFENNSAGHIQVIQGSTSGKLSVRAEPGMYLQLFDNITTYQISDVYDFNSKEERLKVRFGDASTADISGQIKYRLPSSADSILRLHTDFRSAQAIHNDLIKQVVASVLKQSSTYFRAEEVYSTRRADFVDLVNDQIRNGIYATTYREEWVQDTEDEGNKRVLIKRVETQIDKEGKPIISEVSSFKNYGIDLVQLVINDIDFDDATEKLIASRKDSEQKRVVARAEAETAKQNAITAAEQGKAEVAKAEAEALVLAKKEVVEAEKNTKVAAQKALQAEEEKKAIIARGEADAAATKLKVAAGLSPLEKAEIEKDTAIGVAEKLSQVKFPHVMVIGGENASGGKVNPFDAIGLESLMKINRDFINSSKKE